MAANDGATATIIHVHLTRPSTSDAPPDAASWGFRMLQTSNGVGVQSVQRGTLADICGLLAGDDLLSINGRDTATMTLDDARGILSQAGNDVELVVQRGPARIWQPQVTYNQPHVLTGAHETTRSRPPSRRPQSQLGAAGGAQGGYGRSTPQYQHSPIGAMDPVSYSLAMTPRNEVRPIQSLNFPPKPFYLSNVAGMRGPHHHRHHHHHQHRHQHAGASPMIQSAYEPTMGYEEDVAYRGEDTRSTSTGRGRRQARTPLSPANDYGYDDDRKGGAWMKGGIPVLPNAYSPAPPPPPPPPPPPVASNPHFHERRSHSSNRPPRGPAVNAGMGALGGDSPSDPPRCMACTGFITGVFAKIRGRPIHPECFRCNTCGTSLKNRGHFFVNDRLYCDIHARQMEASSHGGGAGGIGMMY